MATQEQLVCQELVELVTEYLEGALGEADQARLEAHLRDCPGCLEYVEQMRRTAAVLGRLAPEVLSAEARGELLQLYRSWKSG